MADVVDNEEAHRFEVEEDGHLAELTYRVEGERIVLVHTGVPEEVGGRGIGGRLVSASVARAAADGLAMVPRCSFARKWLEDHPDEAGAVTVDWGP